MKPDLGMLVAADQRNGPPHAYCRGCHRPMGGEGFLQRGTHDLRYCQTCDRWIRRNPGQLLEDSALGPARVEPQARAIESDTSWRARSACRYVDTQLFEAPQLGNGYVPTEFTVVARTYCQPCPVRVQCAAEADAHQYEGLYGGVLRILRKRRSGSGFEVRRVDLLADEGLD